MSQVALVTGGGRGLGRSFAVALARTGMNVAVASRNPGELDATVALLRAVGIEAIGVPTDVSEEAEVRRLVATTEAKLGPIDLLINGAAVSMPFGPTWETDPQEWWRNIEINLKGPMLCSHLVAKGMVQRQRGRIINVASTAGTLSIAYMNAYVTAKTALIRFTEVLAAELRQHSVYAFSIQPGTVKTAMAEQLMQSEAGKRWLPWFKKIFDEGRDDSSRPGEELVVYLASGKGDSLTGRFLSAPGAPGDLPEKIAQILKGDHNVLRLR
jgi:NAD(P)-dependent dehydrogenase (short-subunit alcohol dehydrogenase family)